MYIYIKNSKIFLTIPVIASSDIATDNTCKTFNVLKKYRDNVQTELDFFDNIFELLGDRYTSQRAQIQQYQELYSSLEEQKAFDGCEDYGSVSNEISEILQEIHSMVLDPQTNRDNFIKSSNPTFSLQHKRFGQEDVSESILGIQLREAITNLERIKLDTPSIDNFKEALPDININDEAPLERCKEVWLQAGFTEDQWTDAGGALEERINQMFELKDEETISFDKDQLCGALDSIWAIIAQNQVSFNSLTNDIFTSTETNEVKIDKIAVLTQFFLGNINIYLKYLDRETINLGQIFDSSEELSSSLANAVQESLIQGDNTADTIIDFLEANALCPELPEEKKEEVKQLFINRYITIKGSDHFDEFFILPKDTNSPWFYYGGAFSLELTQFASKFQVTKDQFKDFIGSRNFNEVTREADNSLPNIDFINHFDFDNIEIVLDENNIHALERLSSTEYKPTIYIYEKIISKIKINGANFDVQSMKGSTPLHWAIIFNSTEIALALINKGANLDIQDQDGRTPLYWTIEKGLTDIALAIIEKGDNLDIQDIYGKTPIHSAIIYNRTEIALALIEKGANLDIKDNPLHLAIEKGLTDIALAIIEKGANLDIQDGKNNTPLYWAIQTGNTEIALALMDKGADIHLKFKNHFTPIHWAIICNSTEIALALMDKDSNLDIQNKDRLIHLYWAIENKSNNIALVLIDKIGHLNLQDKYGLIHLHWAIENRNNDIALALIENGANHNIKTYDGKTPLKWALENRNTEIAHFLIDQGADINLENKDGKKHLQWALENRNTEIAHFLIDQGADIHVENEYGDTPLHLAIVYDINEIAIALINKGANLDIQGKYGHTPLHLTCIKESIEITHFLIDKGANINVKNEYGDTPLHLAIIYNRTEIAIALINKGANLDIQGKYGHTPLHLTCIKESIEITHFLIDKGANINVKNEYGDTPLHWACIKESIEITHFLIDKGADINVENENGNTPLHLALENSKTEIAHFLIDTGANLDVKNKEGKTPLQLAINLGKTQIALAMIAKNPNLEKDLNVSQISFIYAIELGLTNIVNAIIEKGANIDMRDEDGKTPLHWAIIYNRTEIALALINKGAIYNAWDNNWKAPIDYIDSLEKDKDKVVDALTNARLKDINNIIFILTCIATPALLVAKHLLPQYSLILLGCSIVTALVSIITLSLKGSLEVDSASISRIQTGKTNSTIPDSTSNKRIRESYKEHDQTHEHHDKLETLNNI